MLSLSLKAAVFEGLRLDPGQGRWQGDWEKRCLTRSIAAMEAIRRAWN